MPKPQEIKNIVDFIHQTEKLKMVMRHSWLSSGRRESTAEHSWRMALMAMFLHRHLQKNNRPNLEKTLKMILVHDLTEIYAGDVPAWKKKNKTRRHEEEKVGLKKLVKVLPKNLGKSIMDLWEEFEKRTSKEAKFARALDTLESHFQHNEAQLKSWNKGDYAIHFVRGVKENSYDPFLKNLLTLGHREAKSKIKKGK